MVDKRTQQWCKKCRMQEEQTEDDETGRTSNIGNKFERFKMRRNFEQESGDKEASLSGRVKDYLSLTIIYLIKYIDQSRRQTAVS